MHRTSHVSLLTPCPPGRLPGRVDAIVVPTVRPVPTLDFSIDLARRLGCPILLLCSGESQAVGAAERLDRVRGAAVTVSASPGHPLLSMRTQAVYTALAMPYLDTGHKRNLGLLVAAMLGWTRLLFLDDDIVSLDADEVAVAAGHLGRGGMRAVGWRCVDFPDNSVAGHALRSSGADRELFGQEQDVFVGAGALLVDVSGPASFFPSVCNEDWLFCYDAVVKGELATMGLARQRAYHPFQDPLRARREEFGDVLAEGLFGLVHEGRSVLAGCQPGYWREVLTDRHQMLTGVARRLWRLRDEGAHTVGGFELGPVQASVDAALGTLATVTARDLAEFTSAWRYDLYRWRGRLHWLPQFSRVADALNWLGVTDVHVAGTL